MTAVALADALGRTGARGIAGDPRALAEFHRTLYELHERRDPDTAAARRWIASQVHPLLEPLVPPLAPDELPHVLAPAAFTQRIAAEYQARAVTIHPLSRFMATGAPTLAQLAIYLQHQWHRSRSFWREITDLALALPLADAAVIYRNLYEETGAAPGTVAHPTLFLRLLGHLGLPCHEGDRPWLVETLIYMNNRYRCAQHPHTENGLAVMFALEYGTPANHGGIHALLVRLGIAEPYREFHRVHMAGDDTHADDLRVLIEHTVTTVERQREFLRALRHHRALGAALFDKIWLEVQSA